MRWLKKFQVEPDGHSYYLDLESKSDLIDPPLPFQIAFSETPKSPTEKETLYLDRGRGISGPNAFGDYSIPLLKGRWARIVFAPYAEALDVSKRFLMEIFDDRRRRLSRHHGRDQRPDRAHFGDERDPL